MQTLFYWHVPLLLADALVVLDKQATIYYISLGKWNKLVDIVKKDFHSVKKNYQLKPGTEAVANKESDAAKSQLATALEDPGQIDRVRSKLHYKYIFGTPLQHQAWEYLVNKIPVGETSSYSKVARDLGKPNAARVLGGACAANKIALLVPCHRVLTSDDKITGYRWGLALKQELLARERRGRSSAIVEKVVH